MIRTVYFIVLATLLAVIAGCTQSEPAKPLRIGFNTWPGYEFIYLAKVKGFYEAAGVDVKLVELNALGDVRRAFERGQIDIMASTIVEVLIAAENTGRPLKIVAVTDASLGSDMLLAREPITSVSELEGKRVGMEGGTVDVLVAGAALRSAGMSFSDIKVVGKAQDDLVADLKSGDIDALETYPPYALDLLKTERINKIFDSSSIPGEIIDTLSVDGNVLEDRRHDIQLFLKAYFKAFEYFLDNPRDAGLIMGKREGLNVEEFLEAIDGMTIFGPADQAPYLKADARGGDVLKKAGEALVGSGWLQRSPDIKAFFDAKVAQ